MAFIPPRSNEGLGWALRNGHGIQDAVGQLESGGLKASDQAVRTQSLSWCSESLRDLF